MRELGHNLQTPTSPVPNVNNTHNTQFTNDLQISPTGDVHRVEHDRKEKERHAQPRSPHPDRIADQLIVQAEKFKAKIEAPKGNGNYSELLMPYDYDKLRSKFVKPDGLAPIDSEILFLRNFDQDDGFFHVTSQIDLSLQIKIERGNFIDLERLLP